MARGMEGESQLYKSLALQPMLPRINVIVKHGILLSRERSGTSFDLTMIRDTTLRVGDNAVELNVSHGCCKQYLPLIISIYS